MSPGSAPPPAPADTVPAATGVPVGADVGAQVGDAFRAAMRRHVAGVCIVSAGSGGEANGMAVTAATSFSLDPPSVLICINAAASLSAQLGPGALFTLTVLGAEHREVAEAFSRKPGGRARFAAGRWTLPPDGPPSLDDAPANLRCRVVRELAFGSHRALVAEVEAVRLGPDGGSLIYRDGAYA